MAGDGAVALLIAAAAATTGAGAGAGAGTGRGPVSVGVGRTVVRDGVAGAASCGCGNGCTWRIPSLSVGDGIFLRIASVSTRRPVVKTRISIEARSNFAS